MADQKVSDLTPDASPTVDDLIYAVNDPVGVPADRKVTLGNAMLLAPHYVDRSGIAAEDFDQGDLTMDNAWHDLDLSAVVPAGATVVYLRVNTYDNSATAYLLLRKNGSVGAFDARMCRTPVVDTNLENYILVGCDASRVIEYLANETFTAINIVILGWIIDTIN